jgi:CheY-specific phosphatase CheX
MMTWDGKLQAEVSAVRMHTENYLRGNLGLALREYRSSVQNTSAFPLRALTTLIGMGGATSVLVCFTVDKSLADELFRIETQDLDLAGLDRDELMRSTLSELANLVLGHCTAHFGNREQMVSLTAPIIIEVDHLNYPSHQSLFAQLAYETDYGVMEILLFGPREEIDVVSMCGKAL